jgi:hypothetical protein
MSGAKLFDFNSSFSVTRTNPRLTGNFKITLDSAGNIAFNSMNANGILSNDRYKKFNITGQNTFAQDIYQYFNEGNLSNEIVFQIGRFTNGQAQAATKFDEQYDFFYASGASALPDKNYSESFSYFAPLWIKNEIPDYFVILKVPGPMNYPYSTNQTSISPGVKYKVVQNYTSSTDFTISYGVDQSGNPVEYADGDIFTGTNQATSYSILGGTGSVVIFSELANLNFVNDVETTFKEKILPNCSVVQTYDLSENSRIGKYIRKIFNDPNFSNSPIEISWGPNSYSYYRGISVADGVFTKKGEILSPYLSKDDSDSMIDFESYITNGFYRNNIICPNLLNLEFAFNDLDSDEYTINRYMGFYVSRNDIASLRLNGDFFYEYRDLSGNNDLPKPTRNAFGYYYDTTSYGVTSDSGIRLFYENASGFVPGSNDVNLYDPSKLYYLTDKNSNFYSLKRDEGYTSPGGNSPDYSYGPFDYTTGQFSATGSTGATAGSLVIQNKKTDLLNFTGISDKVASIPGSIPTVPGRSSLEVEFLKSYDLSGQITFKIYWPNGYYKEGPRRYDIAQSTDLSSIIQWIDGSYYSSGNTHFFNAVASETSSIALSLSNLADAINSATWDAGTNLSSAVIRLKDYGTYGNTSYSVSVFDNYSYFESNFQKEWNNTSAYSIDGIVIYNGYYYQANTAVSVPSPGNFNDSPDVSNDWDNYITFSNSGYLKINGQDASTINGLVYFEGGTSLPNNRILFPSTYEGFVSEGDFVLTKTGKTKISSISKYVDDPIIDADTKKITGFNNYSYLRVAVLEDEDSIVDLGSDKSFNVYKSSILYLGVFSFFDTKEFDFDFLSSNYGYTPTSETYKYFQIQPGASGSILPNIPYIIKQGQISYANSLYSQGSIFYGATGYGFFDNANPNQNDPVVVFPAEYSKIAYSSIPTTYSTIDYNDDLNAFNGFIGIQGIDTNPLPSTATKIQVFNKGKLNTEYEYLNENYTPTRANLSRIVPFINKWGYSSGTDARGNLYRLNSSPAFTPTNFSPSLDRDSADPRYVTHEWFLLESPPRQFPVDNMQDQNSYLPQKIDLNKARSADPNDYLYLSSFFTVEPSDYASNFRDLTSYTKELFTPFVYNESSGFYETLFRGIKVVLKKRSSLTNTEANSLDKYIPSYRGYEKYKFAAVIRVVEEDDTLIQEPVSYEIIENTQQQFILFVCYVLMDDYRSFTLGHTGSTGGNPILDYTLLYSLSNKEKLNYPIANGDSYYSIDDIKLSCGLDLSLASGSIVNQTLYPGIIYSIENPLYDTDLREEIGVYYQENSPGATSGPSPTGKGSFYVTDIATTYPWPTGVAKNFLEFGKVATGSAPYTFTVPFSTSNPVTVPVGPSSLYKGEPVFQVEGGEGYYDFIMRRTSASDVAKRVNSGSPYVSYKTYIWDSETSTTTVSDNSFELYLQKPTRVIKGRGSRAVKFFGGPMTIGDYNPTSYIIEKNQNLPSTLLRYSGGYSPLFRKIIHFDKDKTDTLYGDSTIDLSFRNCNFAPNKQYFGISRNLSFTKVSLNNNILNPTEKLPEGAVYPLVGQTPISTKNFNVFSSSWDPGYYQRFLNSTNFTSVAGTRSMKEYKTFLGSKIMKTPDIISLGNYITLQISRDSGNVNSNAINQNISSYIKSIQSITPTNSTQGIGSVGPYLSGVDYDKIDPGIFKDAEIIWQYFPLSKQIKGTIRLDRMLRRYLLNSGIKQVFIDNMISEFGVGDPDSINDDVNNYIDINVLPLYQGNSFDLFVSKSSSNDDGFYTNDLILRGDIVSSDRFKLGYYPDPNYKLTKQTSLIYNFEYNLEGNYNYSMLFNLGINKI